jgi:hypothetical protein
MVTRGGGRPPVLPSCCQRRNVGLAVDLLAGTEGTLARSLQQGSLIFKIWGPSHITPTLSNFVLFSRAGSPMAGRSADQPCKRAKLRSR